MISSIIGLRATVKLLKGGIIMCGTKINELALKTTEFMLERGASSCAAWDLYIRAMLPIVKAHTEAGKDEYDSGVIAAYLSTVYKRMENREIGPWRYRGLIRGVNRMTEMHETGKLVWTLQRKSTGYVLNEYYDGIVAAFVANEDIGKKAKKDCAWIGRKYFSWLIQNGHNDLSDVRAHEVQEFMIFCSLHMKGSGLHNVQLYMRKLYRYLTEAGLSAESYEELLSFRVMRGSRLLPALPKNEVMMILDVINRNTPTGKRDYAILLLAVVTGLRSVDIIRLKLRDIDWKNGEIKLAQAKTGKSLALPLTKDVGEAIQEYILRGRQQTTSDEVFLRMHPPYRGFADTVGIGNMYDIYRRQAGLSRKAYDGKGFHALRRSLGTNMVTASIPVTTVAQILGHEDIDSTGRYISLDTAHLKECALDFYGIAPRSKGVM